MSPALRVRPAARPAAVLLLVLVALAAPACSYSSKVVERRELPPLLVRSEPRHEDPTRPRRTEHVVERRREDGLDVVTVEERELADFVTERTEQPRTEIVNRAQVNDMGAWWILPMTADWTRAIWSDDGDGSGMGTFVGWCIGLVFTVPLDAVFGLPHIVRMMAWEANEVELGEARDASIRERDVVVERRDLVPLLDDPRILVDERAWLHPTMGEDGALRFDAADVAPLDDAPLPALRLVGLRDGRQVAVELPWPDGWRAAVRAERGLDMSDAVALGGRAHATARAPARITPGVPATLTVVVTGQGSGDVRGLVGEVRSDHPWLDGRVLGFGRVAPGQSVRADVELWVPDDLPTRGETLTVRFRCSRGRAPDDLRVVLHTGLAAPAR